MRKSYMSNPLYQRTVRNYVEAGDHARQRIAFLTPRPTRIWSEWRDFGGPDARYVVYSYAEHFPMYIWVEATKQWFCNTDRYSISTTNHQRTCRPQGEMEYRDTAAMRQIATYGIYGSVRRMIFNAHGDRRAA